VLLKSRVPHEAFLFSGALEVLFNFLVRLLVLVPLLVWYDPRWSASFLLAPVGVVSLLLLGTALGLLLAPVGLLYPDVQRGLGVVTGLLFFLTPVLYPPANGLLGSANPVTPLLVTARRWLAGGDVTAAPGFAPVLAAASLGVAVAWVGYRLARPHLIVRL
jgi:lipopolysaccharide transport system permease protein